ncbi:hypothetical protein BSLG_004638 [Batrachochytrium salamandrivorans]|nr:hypothetical protein BSLG_004638 [Batrachochytrium salamandrivorans]
MAAIPPTKPTVLPTAFPHIKYLCTKAFSRKRRRPSSAHLAPLSLSLLAAGLAHTASFRGSPTESLSESLSGALSGTLSESLSGALSGTLSESLSESLSGTLSSLVRRLDARDAATLSTASTLPAGHFASTTNGMPDLASAATTTTTMPLFMKQRQQGMATDSVLLSSSPPASFSGYGGGDSTMSISSQLSSSCSSSRCSKYSSGPRLDMSIFEPPPHLLECAMSFNDSGFGSMTSSSSASPLATDSCSSTDSFSGHRTIRPFPHRAARYCSSNETMSAALPVTFVPRPKRALGHIRRHSDGPSALVPPRQATGSKSPLSTLDEFAQIHQKGRFTVVREQSSHWRPLQRRTVSRFLLVDEAAGDGDGVSESDADDTDACHDEDSNGLMTSEQASPKRQGRFRLGSQ